MYKLKKEWGKATKQKAQNDYVFWAGHYDVVLEGSKDGPLLVFTQKYDDLQPRNLFIHWYEPRVLEKFSKTTTLTLPPTQPLYSLLVEIMFRSLNRDKVRLAELVGPLFSPLPNTPDYGMIKEPLAEWHRVAVKLRSL